MEVKKHVQFLKVKALVTSAQLIVHDNTSSQYLFVQSELWKHQNDVWNVFKFNSKDTPFLLTWNNLTHWSGV